MDTCGSPSSLLKPLSFYPQLCVWWKVKKTPSNLTMPRPWESNQINPQIFFKVSVLQWLAQPWVHLLLLALLLLPPTLRFVLLLRKFRITIVISLLYASTLQLTSIHFCYVDSYHNWVTIHRDLLSTALDYPLRHLLLRTGFLENIHCLWELWLLQIP